MSTDMDTAERLARIEQAVDERTEAMMAIARVEERIIAIWVAFTALTTGAAAWVFGHVA
jgi:hypothetical protein